MTNKPNDKKQDEELTQAQLDDAAGGNRSLVSSSERQEGAKPEFKWDIATNKPI